jgi:hypothetical protein
MELKKSVWALSDWATSTSQLRMGAGPLFTPSTLTIHAATAIAPTITMMAHQMLMSASAYPVHGDFLVRHRPIEISINLPVAFFQKPGAIPDLWRRMPDHPAFDGMVIKINGGEARGRNQTIAVPVLQLEITAGTLFYGHPRAQQLGRNFEPIAKLRSFYCSNVPITADRNKIALCVLTYRTVRSRIA